MAVQEQEKIYTAEDLWELSHSAEYAGMRLELVEGELIVMSPAGGEHGGVAADFLISTGSHVKKHKLGYTTAAETGYILGTTPAGRDIVYAPDVGFVAMARFPNGLPEKYIPGAPDLAVEVVSPNDAAAEVEQKVANYLKYGTRMVWVAYPKTRNVFVHTPQGVKVVGIDGTLDGGDVLPGFTLPVREIFGG